MSIYTTLESMVTMEKTALARMDRRRYSEAATPYATRKKEYTDFMKKRSKTRKPGQYDYVPGMATVGGIAGGLMGAITGFPGGAATTAVGAVGGGLLGAGIGALGGISQASAERSAIEDAKKVVKGGQFDKALQDEIMKYRRYKEYQAEAERAARHDDITRRLDRIENANKSRSTTRVYIHTAPIGSRSRRGGPRRY